MAACRQAGVCPLAEQYCHSAARPYGRTAALRAHPEHACADGPTQPKLGPQAGTTASPLTPAPGANDTPTAVGIPAGAPLEAVGGSGALLVPLSLAPIDVAPDAAVLSRAARSFNPSIGADDTPEGADFAKVANRANIRHAKVSRLFGGVPLSFVEAACTQKPTTISLDAAAANTLNVRSLVTNAAAGNAGAVLVGGWMGWGGGVATLMGWGTSPGWSDMAGLPCLLELDDDERFCWCCGECRRPVGKGPCRAHAPSTPCPLCCGAPPKDISTPSP